MEGKCTIIEHNRKTSIIIQRGKDTLAIHSLDPKSDRIVMVPFRATRIVIELDSIANILGHLEVR